MCPYSRMWVTFIIESFKITRLWDPVVRCKQNCVVSPACQRADEAPSNMESLEPFVPLGLSFSRTSPQNRSFRLTFPPISLARSSNCSSAPSRCSNFKQSMFGGKGLPSRALEGTLRFCIVHQADWLLKTPWAVLCVAPKSSLWSLVFAGL